MTRGAGRTAVLLLTMGAFAGAAAPAHAQATVTGVIAACASLKDGSLRVVPPGQTCGKSEQAIQWNLAGPKGDPGTPGAPGPQGPPGASLGSLIGVPCNTESNPPPMPPDGAISVVTLLQNKMSLTCVSNVPVLTVSDQPGTHLFAIDGTYGGTFCLGVYATVAQVDDTGAPVPGGFGCNQGQAGFCAANACSTDAFSVGAVVHLRATPPAPPFSFPPPGGVFQAVWLTGCDSVDGDICTVTIKPGPQGVVATLAPSSY